MKKLGAHYFTLNNHCHTFGYSIFNLWDFDKNKPKKEWHALGYCEASRVLFRPNKEGYVVLLERIKGDAWNLEPDNIGETTWLHVPFVSDKQFKQYCDDY